MKMKAVLLEASAISKGDVSFAPVEALCDLKTFERTTEQEKWDRLRDAEIILDNKLIIDEEVLSRYPSIRYIGVCATGYNVIDLEAARRHNVTVTNVPAYSTASVAQHTMALLLDLASKITLHSESVRRGGWAHSPVFCYWEAPVTELAGRTLGIVGYGSIGRSVARIAASLGMNILVSTRHPEKYTASADDTLHFVSFDEMLSSSDAITFHCPLTDETEHMVNADTISRMKDGVFLINTARGGLVNEADLAAALKSGKVAGAGVDVISEEPMKPDNPLLTAPNILITPHIAWASIEARTRLVNQIAGNLSAWLEGRPVNVVS